MNLILMNLFSKLKDILVLSNYIRLGDVYKKCVIHVNNLNAMIKPL